MSEILDFIHRDGLATFLVLFSVWFLVSRVWPFVTKEVWPQVKQDRQNELKLLSDLGKSIDRLSVVFDRLEEMSGAHSQEMRDGFQHLSEENQDILLAVTSLGGQTNLQS